MLFSDVVDGRVVNRPIYTVLGVPVYGKHDILSLWASEHGDGERTKDWLQVLAEIKYR